MKTGITKAKLFVTQAQWAYVLDQRLGPEPNKQAHATKYQGEFEARSEATQVYLRSGLRPVYIKN